MPPVTSPRPGSPPLPRSPAGGPAYWDVVWGDVNGVAHGDELHLLGVEIDTNFTRAPGGRLLAERVPHDPAPAPHLLVATAPQGRTADFGTEVPGQAADAVRRLLAEEPPACECRTARYEAPCASLLAGAVGPIWIERVPCFIVDAVPEATCAGAVVTSADGVAVDALGLAPERADEGRGPWAAVVEDGRAVAVCSTARCSEQGVEAGTWTDPGHRGRGYAAAATAAWAGLPAHGGRHRFYCTNDWNRSSRGVAARLALRSIGWMWKVNPGRTAR